jgi:class 3 adenylate cyclase
MAVQRRLAAILAADVAVYSRLMGEDEEGTRARFNSHLSKLIGPAIASRRGRIVKTTGDGLLVEFASAVDATECAIKIHGPRRRALERRALLRGYSRSQLRMTSCLLSRM